LGELVGTFPPGAYTTLVNRETQEFLVYRLPVPAPPTAFKGFRLSPEEQADYDAWTSKVYTGRTADSASAAGNARATVNGAHQRSIAKINEANRAWFSRSGKGAA
jgi:hypothetical protein